MHEQIGQRGVHAIAAQAPHAGRIGLLPRRLYRHRDLRRPAGRRAERQHEPVADRFITAAAPVKHPCQHRHMEIRVIDHPHLMLAVVTAVKPSGILGDPSAP